MPRPPGAAGLSAIIFSLTQLSLPTLLLLLLLLHLLGDAPSQTHLPQDRKHRPKHGAFHHDWNHLSAKTPKQHVSDVSGLLPKRPVS